MIIFCLIAELWMPLAVQLLLSRGHHGQLELVIKPCRVVVGCLLFSVSFLFDYRLPLLYAINLVQGFTPSAVFLEIRYPWWLLADRVIHQLHEFCSVTIATPNRCPIRGGLVMVTLYLMVYGLWFTCGLFGDSHDAIQWGEKVQRGTRSHLTICTHEKSSKYAKKIHYRLSL